MRLKSPQATCVLIFASFLLVAVAQSWPLARHFDTHLTGAPGGDTGVYVWNTWVFRRELLEFGRQPYSTDALFWSGLPANLSLHNYTPLADALAALIQPLAGIVGAFNLIYLLNTALAGFGMYLLAARHTGDRFAAWLAGLLFACSPFLVARSLGHFSLAAAAPLAFFAWQIERTLERPSVGRAIAAGAIAAWAGMSDPYYVVYCLMLGALIAAARFVRLETAPMAAQTIISKKDIAIAGLAVAVAALAVWRISEISIGPLRITMRTLYSPVLIVTALAAARILVRLRPRFSVRRAPSASEWRIGAVTFLSAAVLLSPWLFAVVKRMADGTMVGARVLWRSSTAGVDLLSLFVPNPMNPLMPDGVRAWMAATPSGFVEQVASLPVVALIAILIARRGGARFSRFWVVVTILFAVLALGPFVHVAGVNTYIPTPWTFLRYLPVIDLARAPSRFAVIAVMGLAVLFAQAAAHWRLASPRRGLVTAALAGLLCAELLPAPRPLFSADIPTIYNIVAADTRPVGLLELPFGLRDGMSSLGDFTPMSQFFQTFHKKPLYGGYLSRISDKRKATYRARPVLGAFMTLSEGGHLTADQTKRARDGALSFVDRTKLGYVVIDEARAAPELRDFAISLLRLRKIGSSGSRELYAPDIASARALGEPDSETSHEGPSGLAPVASRRPSSVAR